MKYLLLILSILFSHHALAFGGSEKSPNFSTSVPPQAQAVGYTTMTFGSTFSSDIDLTKSYNTGYNWYLWNLNGSNASSDKVIPTNKGVTLLGDVTGPGAELVSVALKSGTYVGTAFGGGAYVEGMIQILNPANNGGQVAFWGYPIETQLGLIQWSGQTAGYSQFVENDFLEYIYSDTPGCYSATLHDWYGIYNSTCPPGFCDTSSTQCPIISDSIIGYYHKYGMLWVPATVSTSGYVQYYFDDNPIGSPISWTQFTNQSPTPISQPWRFGVTDTQHMNIILGTGVGNPFNVRWVRVWQVNSTNNWHK